MFPTVCVLAGGLGSRLGERVASTPKPLLEVAGEPFLVHQLRSLAAYGCTQVVLCVGYLGEQIEQRIGDEQFGIRVHYSYDSPGQDGTLGAIRRALPFLGERFLVLYGDTYLRINYQEVLSAWDASGCVGLMTVFLNDNRWDRSNVVYAAGRVVVYDKGGASPGMRWIDYGLGGLAKDALTLVADTERDLAPLYKLLAENHALFGYEAHRRFYEIGTPDGLAETEAFLANDSSEP
jgi:N-acetyl-alpha-D-muramate 1-phosphate uridylyltransferase